MMKYFSAIVIALTMTIGCAEEPVTTNAELQGSWTGVEIKRNDLVQPYIDFSFNFALDSTYTYKGGNHTEKGTYLISGNKLITQAEGDLEKQVEIEKVTSDTLLLNMNDAGTAMKMLLVKE